MRAYGRKKMSSKVAGHQECGGCHPEQKNEATRARREGQAEVEAEVDPKETK